jgi:hypothetical protein
MNDINISNERNISLPVEPIIRKGQHREMITGPQIRAARALLGWSPVELATKSKLSYPTIQRAESAPGIPPIQAPNLFAIQRALEGGGVIFLDAGKNEAGGAGVRLRD